MAAKNYTEILALVNAGNQMGLSNTIKRDYGIPLDFTSVQPTYNDAVIYAAENTKAYVGQPLSVGGKLYIINDVAAEAKLVVGDKEYDNYLVEVGSATEGDGVTIDLEAGVLTLHGFESALTGYLPRKSENGELEWVPISAVVQGDGNKVTTLTSEDGSVTVTKKTDTDESLVYDLSVEVYDDTELAGRVKAIEDDYLKAEDKYNDTDLQNRVKAIEDDYLKTEDKYDDTALAARVKALEDEERYDETPLANRVGALETAVGDAESGLVKDLADEIARATEAERQLGLRIDGIDYVDAGELATELEPYAKTADVEAGLALKADKTALEELAATVDAFLTGDGTEAALDSLKELIAYIDEHDGADLTEMIATIERIEGKLEGIDSTVAAYVTAAIDALKIGDYAKAADLTALAGRVEALEAKPFDTYATKTEVESAIATAKSEAIKDADDKLATKVASTDFETFKSENTTAIGTAKSEAIAAAAKAVEDAGYAVASDVATTYATKTELGEAVEGIENDLLAYAKTEDVNTELAKKIETGSIAHSSETLAEGVTVEGTKLNIVVDAYTKQEVRDYVADVIEDMTGGESAADVLLALNNHIDTYTEKVGQIDAKDAAQDTAIAAAKTQADKGVEDAAAAQGVADAAKALAEQNKTDIAGHLNRIGVLETAKGDHETRISTVEGQVEALIAEDIEINKDLGEVQGQIVTLQGEDGRLAGLISANQQEIAKKANATEVYTIGQADKAIEDAIKAIPAVDLNPYAKTEDVAKTYATIAALEGIYKAGSGVEGEDGYVAPTGVLADEIARAKAAEQKITDDLAILIENPTEALDSVKELIAHVQAHGTVVEGIIERLDGHDDILSDITDRVDALEAKPEYTLPAATASALGGVMLSDEIGVNTSGQLKINKVSTDVLINGEEELILFGGTSSN